MPDSPSQDRSLGRWMLAGAAEGAMAWFSYGLVEHVLTSSYAFIEKARMTFTPPFIGWLGFLILSYTVVGAVFGLLAAVATGRLRARDPQSILRPAATLSVLAVFIANLAVRFPLTGYEIVAGCIALALAAVQVLWITASDRWARMRFLSGPATATLLFLAVLWMAKELFEFREPTIILASAGSAMIAIAAASWFIHGRIAVPRLAGLASVTILLAAQMAAFNRTLPSLPAKPAASAQQTNVVLISMDTVRADHTSLYGYSRDTTPHLKGLAAESVLYSRAYSAGDMTLPSHVSMLTGVYARTHGAHYFPPDLPDGRPIPQRLSTMAEILSKQGYATMGVVANHAYLSAEWGFARGFDVYDRRAPVPILDPKRRFYLRNVIRALLEVFISTAEFDRVSSRAESVSANAQELIRQARTQGRPFFLFLNYMDAHHPYVPPAPYDRKFSGTGAYIPVANYVGLEHDVLARKHTVTPEERRILVDRYDGGIAYLDHCLGTLIDGLRQSGVLDQTLLIVTSDHGEAFGEDYLIGHGGLSARHDQITVPMLIRYPRANRKGVVDSPVSHIDILPTVLDELGLPRLEWIQGQNLRETVPANRTVVSESYPGAFYIKIDKRFNRIERAVVEGDKKLIVSTLGKTELYNLATDPKETRNLFQENDPQAIALRTHLAAWLKAIPPNHGGGAKPSKETLDNLKSLGYVQ